MAHVTMHRVDLEVDTGEAMYSKALEQGEMGEAIVARITMHSLVLEQGEMWRASLTDVSGKD